MNQRNPYKPQPHNKIMAIDYEKVLKQSKKGGVLTDVKTKLTDMLAPAIYPNLQFVGLEQLKPFQDDFFKNKVRKFYQKILDNYFKNIRYFQAEIKLHERKAVGRQKYSIHLRLALPSKVFSAEYAGFDIDAPLSYVIKALDKELVRFRERTREQFHAAGKGEAKATERRAVQQARQNKRRR